MSKHENDCSLVTGAFDPGGRQIYQRLGDSDQAMNDPSLVLPIEESSQDTTTMDSRPRYSLDIFGDDELFENLETEPPSTNSFDSLLSQAAAEAGVYPFMDEGEDSMDLQNNIPPPSVATNQVLVPSAHTVVSMPQPATNSMPQKVNTVPMINQTLQPLMTGQPSQATTALIRVTPSGQQIIQQFPANAQGGQPILLQGLVRQFAPVKTPQGILGTMQFQQGISAQQQPLTSYVLNTGQTQFQIPAVINSKLNKASIKSGPVAISPKPSPKGPRHISPKPQPGQRVIQFVSNPTARTLQIAPRAQTQQQTFLIRNSGLQLVQGLNTGHAVITNSGVVRAPNYQFIQGRTPASNVLPTLPSMVTTQTNVGNVSSSTVMTTQASNTLLKSTNTKKKKVPTDSALNYITTQSNSASHLTAASIATPVLTGQGHGGFAQTALNQVYGTFGQPSVGSTVHTQPTIVTVTENKTSHPVITIGASGNTIVVKQSKPIMVTAANPGLGTETVVTSVSGQKLMTGMNSFPSQQVANSGAFSTQSSSNFLLPASSANGPLQINLTQSKPQGQQANPRNRNAYISGTPMPFNVAGGVPYQSVPVSSSQPLLFTGQTMTKPTNIPPYANQIRSQPVTQTVLNNTVTTFVNAAQHASHNQSITPVTQTLQQQNGQTTLLQSGMDVVQNTQMSLQQQQVIAATANVQKSLYQGQLQGQWQQNISASCPRSTGQGTPFVMQNQAAAPPSQEDQHQKIRNLQIFLQQNPKHLKELMTQNRGVFQNLFKNNPQLQQKFQPMLQKIEQLQQLQQSGSGYTVNVTGNVNIQPSIQQSQFSASSSNSMSDLQPAKYAAPSSQFNEVNRQQNVITNQSSEQSNLQGNTDCSGDAQSIIVTGKPQTVISAQVAAIMKYPPNRSQSNNNNTTPVTSSGTSSNNTDIHQQGLFNSASQSTGDSQAASTGGALPNQPLNLPPTFQISIEAQEQLQTIQNHIRTLTGIQNPNIKQKGLLKQLQQIQHKIVAQVRQQMLVQQNKQAEMAAAAQAQGNVSKFKKVAAQNVAMTSKQNASAGQESGNINQGQVTPGLQSASRLTLNQQQAVRAIQEKLKTMTPEQQHTYIKSQQSILQLFHQQQQQQKLVNQGPPVPTVISADQVDTKGLKRSAQYQLTRSSLMQHQINQNQEKTIAPDLTTSFRSYKDAVQRLMNYHVSTDHISSPEQLQEIDDAFDEVSTGILEKKQKMYDKYQQLLIQDSMKKNESSEMVMLGRMFLQDEKSILQEERALPQEQLLAKLRSLPPRKNIEEKDNKLPNEVVQKNSDVEAIMQTDIAIDESHTQKVSTNVISPATYVVEDSTDVLTNVQVISPPCVELVSPVLDDRTKNECDAATVSASDCNEFITRELPIGKSGRQKTLKLKFKLRPPSTLQDLLEDHESEEETGNSELDESGPEGPLNAKSGQSNNKYDVYEVAEVKNEVIDMVNDLGCDRSFVKSDDGITIDESTRNSNDSDEENGDDDEDDEQEEELNSSGALSEQNQSAINHILSFRNHDNDDRSALKDSNQSRVDSMVNGLEFEFDDDDEEENEMEEYTDTEKVIHKLDQDLEELTSYEYGTPTNMQDPDLEEAVNSILF